MKHELHRMTWKEAEAAFQEDPVVIIPLGSMEQHGPHGPMGDYQAAAEVALRVAKNTGSYCIPTLPFGYSEYFRGFPGTVSLTAETVKDAVLDICDCLFEHGFSRLVFFNGHAGNAPVLDRASRIMRRTHKRMVPALNLWQMLTPEFKKELYKEQFNPSGHGAEPMTSVMMYLTPDDMRMDLLGTVRSNKEWNGFPIVSFAKAKLKDTEVALYFDMDEMSPDGVMGNPLAGSAENGEAIINKVVEYGTAFVEMFKKADTAVRK